MSFQRQVNIYLHINEEMLKARNQRFRVIIFLGDRFQMILGIFEATKLVINLCTG